MVPNQWHPMVKATTATMTTITTTCSAGTWRTEIREGNDSQSEALSLSDALYVWGLDTAFHPTIIAAKELVAEVCGTASLILDETDTIADQQEAERDAFGHDGYTRN